VLERGAQSESQGEKRIFRIKALNIADFTPPSVKNTAGLGPYKLKWPPGSQLRVICGSPEGFEWVYKPKLAKKTYFGNFFLLI
jgi:hypothetical protein